LNAPTYYTTLAPNDALPDPNFATSAMKAHNLKFASKNFRTTRGC